MYYYGQFQYDSNDRMSKCLRCALSVRVLRLDLLGRITNRVNRRGQILTYGYDADGLRVSRAGAGLNDRFGYDAVGRLAACTSGAEVTSFSRAMRWGGSRASRIPDGHAADFAYNAAGSLSIGDVSRRTCRDVRARPPGADHEHDVGWRRPSRSRATQAGW